MSTPGSNRNKKSDDGRRKQSGDTVAFNLPTAGWTPEERAMADTLQAAVSRPFNPNEWNLTETPTGPLDIRMGRLPSVPDSPRSSSRHHKSNPHSAPGPYNGPAAVQRTPTHLTSERINDFPQGLGGRSRGYPEAPPKPSQRPRDYPQPGYQTAPYPSSMAAPGVPRSPDAVTGHRITMAMGQRPPQSGGPQQAPRPGHADPRYPSNGRGY
ncbi:hypothetical protein FB451DRAFT_1284921 [Mycena latifolia]|nr:hypothetical protein FB451DRAFT_1284921 [Mycena latifolia]